MAAIDFDYGDRADQDRFEHSEVFCPRCGEPTGIYFEPDVEDGTDHLIGWVQIEFCNCGWSQEVK